MTTTNLFTFGVRRTKCGCVVWMKTPNGHLRNARFRDCTTSAMVSASKWVLGNVRAIREHGKPAEFEIPDELRMEYDNRLIQLPVELWDRLEEMARSSGCGVFAFIEKACVDRLDGMNQ